MHFHQFLVSRQLGGAAKVGLGLAEWLRDNGRSVHIWTPGDGPAADAVRRKKIPENRYMLRLMERGPVGRLFGAPFLMAGLHHRSGLAHLHGTGAYRAIRALLRFTRMHTVVHLHGVPETGEIAWAFRYPPDLVITCARFLVPMVRAELPERGVHVPVIAVPNAIATDVFFPGDRGQSKQAVGASPDRPLVLMLANLAQHKGQQTAIRATAILRDRGIEVECWLAGVERDGSGNYTRHLRSLIDKLKVGDQVRLLGMRVDAPMLLRAADFVLLPSTWEGLPLSILEAQACGVPVLAAPIAGIPEIIRDGESGFLIAAADPVGYADRIELLLKNPELASRITQRALRMVRQEHSWEIYCRRIGQLYQEILGADR